MLARLKKAADPDVAYYRSALKLPRPGPEYLLAEKASRSANLRGLTEHRERV